METNSHLAMKLRARSHALTHGTTQKLIPIALTPPTSDHSQIYLHPRDWAVEWLKVFLCLFCLVCDLVDRNVDLIDRNLFNLVYFLFSLFVVVQGQKSPEGASRSRHLDSPRPGIADVKEHTIQSESQ